MEWVEDGVMKWKLVVSKEELQRNLEFGQVSEEGIIYEWELAGPQGADYFIFPAKHHSKEDIKKTKRWIRYSFDCVSLKVVPYEGDDYPIPRVPEEWTPEQREQGFRKIVEGKSFGRVENCVCVDVTTANAVVQVLDALNPENKAKMLSFDALTIIDLTWKLVEKSKK